MKLLFVASDAREFGGLLRHCTGVRKLDLPLDWARAGTLGQYQVAMAVNGVGAEQGAAAAEAVLGEFAADALISVGFAGALDPALRLYEIVVDQTPRLPQSARPHRVGMIHTAARIARTAEEKARLLATGAIAVEMEAAGVAGRAQARGLPFFCIKVVTDLACESLSNDFNAALRSDGHFDTIRILASSLRNPWVRVPELFRLQSRCPVAARSLGDFIADCRF